jgi:predicted DNA-binding transcriptional regulator YafY
MVDLNQKNDNKDADADVDTETYARSRKISATFVNNFLVTGTSSMMRIAFAESAEEPLGPQYRVAVVLPIEDAKELGRIVLKMAAEIENEIDEKP